MSAHRALSDIFNAATMTDPGASGTITITKSPVTVLLASAGAETRTLARPTRAGAIATLIMMTDGGDITLTVTGNYSEGGDSTFTFSDPGQWAMFVAGYESSGGTYYWRKVADYSTGNLTPTELGYLDGVTAGTAAASKALVLGASQQIGGSGSNIAFQDRITTTDGVSSGTAKVIGGLAYSNAAASTAIASTSAETAFDTSYTMPANTLKAGTVVKVRCWATGTTVVGTDTVALKLYIGGLSGTALITSAATTMVNGHTWLAEAQLHCRTAGTTGTAVAVGTYKVNSAEGTMTVKDDVTASFTINTQASQVITASAQFNTTNANSIRMDIFSVEIY